VLPRRATYRLQLHRDFSFDDAAAVVDYVAALGVSHVYCSPYLQAAPGSTHGYDVVDPGRVNEELGGEAGRRRLLAALATAGLGQVLDIVPNHMAITAENRWWWDVLENGPASPYATHFDVDWDPPEQKLRNTVLLPILADHYGRVLEAGEIVLVFADAWFTVRYGDRVLPVAPPSIDTVLLLAAGALDGEGVDDLAFIGASLARLPKATATDRVSVGQRARETAVLRRQLARLCSELPGVADAIAEVVHTVNREPDALDRLLERQNYRLAHWRTAGRELPYRRFFDIDTLAGLRMEDERVFSDTHHLVLDWLAAGDLDGVRVDHPDGLRDPAEYCGRLRAAAPGAWVVVEKILESGEHLPPWPVDGTTGYDALNLVNGLLVDRSAERAFTDLYATLTGETRSFEDVAYEAKHDVMRSSLAADVNRLTALLVQVGERHRRYRDYTRHDLHEAVREVLACLSVYRTYTGDAEPALLAATKEAAGRRPDLDPDLLDFLGRLLAGPDAGEAEAELRLRFQQTSSPVMAKGVEDTAFYRYNRLLSLNEVGGSPDQFGVGLDEVHRELARLADDWPGTMTTLSTHDTKRSEDVRARLDALTHRPEAWRTFAARWLDDEDAVGVDRNAQYHLLQAFVGAWPLAEDRALQYAEKAVREAKVRTAWTAVDASYEANVRAWVSALIGDRQFAEDVDGLLEWLGPAGRALGLAQKLVQLTMPGIPDVYQGCELENLSLVDPDNRRPVDYGVRRRLLARVRGGDVRAAPKLAVVVAALDARARLGELGAYEPLDAPPGVFAFRRGRRLATVVPVVPDVTAVDAVDLGPGAWRNLLPDVPVALYERTS
jgi:(1->4)-alpha-D-glucan 1-alpha-D-glucosylmutase